MYEVTRSGTVLRKIEPTPTGDQLKARQEEEARAEEAAKAAAEQRRKDLALLSTYSTEKDIDTSRDLNLKPIEGRIKSAKERIAGVDKRVKELEAEMEFYKAGKSSKAAARSREPPAAAQGRPRAHQARRRSRSRSPSSDYEKEMEEVREPLRHRQEALGGAEADAPRGQARPARPQGARGGQEATADKPGVKKYNLYLVPAN